MCVPGKTTALVPESAVEDLPSAEMQLRFRALAVKELPLGRTLMMMMMMMMMMMIYS